MKQVSEYDATLAAIDVPSLLFELAAEVAGGGLLGVGLLLLCALGAIAIRWLTVVE